MKIDISPYLSEKSSDFYEILYTAADFELDERHVIKNEKVALDRLRVRQNVFLVVPEMTSKGRSKSSAMSVWIDRLDFPSEFEKVGYTYFEARIAEMTQSWRWHNSICHT